MSEMRAAWLLLATVICFVGMPREGRCQDSSLTVASPHGTDSPRKFENGFQIFWRDTALAGDPHISETDPNAAIEIFDSSANELAACDVAIAIRAADSSATGVSIYDVSARKPGFIAVAAVYTRINRGPVALMLYFDWDGSLQRKVVLDKLSQIESLEIDSAGHVWTLNAFDRENPAKSVFTEFNRAGSVIKDLVKPKRHWSTNEGTLKGGQTSFGVTSGRAWTWLPESRTLILVDDHRLGRVSRGARRS